MNNCGMNTYEMKRKIVNFSKNISEGLNKSTSKFVMDMEYGLAKSKSVLLSNIAKSLEESINLDNTIERLSDNLVLLKDEEQDKIKKNYLEETNDKFAEEAIPIFDDSDTAKPHSEIYSCKSKEFVSKNKYTLESIDTVRNVLKRKCNMVFDRGYDDNKIINYVDKNGDYFVIRMEDKRNFICKGKKKDCHEMAIRRKGKIKMTLWFYDKEEHEISVSHTKVVLPCNKKEYELVFVYGLDEKHPIILLTNIGGE